MNHRTGTCRTTFRLVNLLALLMLASLASGCIVTPAGHDYGRRDAYREGYFDRTHHRWYHDHRWVQCGPRDVHCR